MKTWHYAMVVFLGGCSFGVLSTFVKLAYAAGYSMQEVTGSQFLLGTLLIWTVVLFTKQKRVDRKQTIRLLLSGIPMGLTGMLYYQSLQTLDASLAIIFLFQFVWIGTLLEWLIYRKKPTRGKIASIAVLLVGSVLAAGLLTNGATGLSWKGMAWGILSAFSFSSFILLSSIVGRDSPPLYKSALMATGGMVVIYVLFPPVFLLDWSTFRGIAPYGLFLGLFGVVLPPLLFSIGMPHVGAGLGTILSASELPVAVIMSAVVLAEVVGLSQWIGVLLILAGIVGGNFDGSKHKQEKAA